LVIFAVIQVSLNGRFLVNGRSGISLSFVFDGHRQIISDDSLQSSQILTG
jgi:hypothetical protein